MNCNIAVIKGDGVGPEIIDEGIKVLNKICCKFNHRFDCEYVLAGGCAIDETGEPLPNKTVEVCRKTRLYYLVLLEDQSGINVREIQDQSLVF